MNNVLITEIVKISPEVKDYWSKLKIDICAAIVDKDDKQQVKDARALIFNTEVAISAKFNKVDLNCQESERQAEYYAEQSLCGFDY